MTTTRTQEWLKLRASKLGWVQRLRIWLVFKLLRGGIPIELEVRHSAHRARVRQIWSGQLVRAEIPVGRPSSKETQASIDAFTAVRAHNYCQTCHGKGFVE